MGIERGQSLRTRFEGCAITSAPCSASERAASGAPGTEVAMWAHRPFAALVWSGAFERHPNLKMIFTETGCSWILETLRTLEWKAPRPG